MSQRTAGRGEQHTGACVSGREAGQRGGRGAGELRRAVTSAKAGLRDGTVGGLARSGGRAPVPGEGSKGVRRAESEGGLGGAGFPWGDGGDTPGLRPAPSPALLAGAI